MTSLLRKESITAFVKNVKGHSRLMWWEKGSIYIGAYYEVTEIGHAMSLLLEVDDRLATKEEVLKEWADLKLNKNQAGARKCQLRVDVMDELIMIEAVRNIRSLLSFFQFQKWPVSAQLVGCLIGFAPMRKDLRVYQALRAGDWGTAASLYDGPWKPVVVETWKGIQDAQQ